MMQYGIGYYYVYLTGFNVFDWPVDSLYSICDIIQLCAPSRCFEQFVVDIERINLIGAEKSELGGYFAGTTPKVQNVLPLQSDVSVDPFLLIERPVAILPVAETNIRRSGRLFSFPVEIRLRQDSSLNPCPVTGVL